LRKAEEKLMPFILENIAIRWAENTRYIPEYKTHYIPAQFLISLQAPIILTSSLSQVNLGRGLEEWNNW
jgi:hypothetical protein